MRQASFTRGGTGFPLQLLLSFSRAFCSVLWERKSIPDPLPSVSGIALRFCPGFMSNGQGSPLRPPNLMRVCRWALRPCPILRLYEAAHCPQPLPLSWRRRCRLLRSEEHTSELQSPCNLVCRLLLEKKK